ncbi:MAG: hypothetical protein KAU20_06860 [Nanoarchaeota archaeon]|nr:hypothetical protein [Nanoarchaeota archaeon]
MKVVKEKVKVELDTVEIKSTCLGKRTTFTVVAEGAVFPGDKYTLVIEREEPSNMREFLSRAGVSEKRLITWLNRNYK